jgi:hypothetical protein
MTNKEKKIYNLLINLLMNHPQRDYFWEIYHIRNNIITKYREENLKYIKEMAKILTKEL